MGGFTNECDINDKATKKKLRNRLSAQRARDRQKARMQLLEMQIQHLMRENIKLTHENEMWRFMEQKEIAKQRMALGAGQNMPRHVARQQQRGCIRPCTNSLTQPPRMSLVLNNQVSRPLPHHRHEHGPSVWAFPVQLGRILPCGCLAKYARYVPFRGGFTNFASSEVKSLVHFKVNMEETQPGHVADYEQNILRVDGEMDSDDSDDYIESSDVDSDPDDDEEMVQ